MLFLEVVFSKYSVGPSFKDLNIHIFTDFIKEELKSYESYEQLMIILPPKSYNLLSEKYKKILEEKILLFISS